MRAAKTSDHWRRVNKRNYKHVIENVDLSDLHGIPALQLKAGIFAICGLNGTGKSTIIAGIKDTLGIPLTSQDRLKIGDHPIKARIKHDNNVIECENKAGSRYSDKVDINDLYYLDASDSTLIMDFFCKQENLDELIEQFEENQLTDADIDLLNYVIGKDYTTCCFYEIEDIEQLGDWDDSRTFPYFIVKTNNVDYNSTSMGVGEHFLFYIFWSLQKVHESSIVIIEEPESFISITSQKHLMNYLASISSEKGVTFILSTHSPYILEQINPDNIVLISRFGAITATTIPNEHNYVDNILGIKLFKKGTIFVEDYAAKCFLYSLLKNRMPIILNDFCFEYVNGESEITKRLQFPRISDSYIFVGVYDKDMENKIDKDNLKIHWDYCFLPTIDAIEKDIYDYVKANIEQIASGLKMTINSIVPVLAKISGYDKHDWFSDFCSEIHTEPQLFMNCFYDLWSPSHEGQIESFVENLKDICNYK